MRRWNLMLAPNFRGKIFLNFKEERVWQDKNTSSEKFGRWMAAQVIPPLHLPFIHLQNIFLNFYLKRIFRPRQSCTAIAGPNIFEIHKGYTCDHFPPNPFYSYATSACKIWRIPPMPDKFGPASGVYQNLLFPIQISWILHYWSSVFPVGEDALTGYFPRTVWHFLNIQLIL